MIYNPFNWHWIVGGDGTRYWSSAVGSYVTELPEDAGVTRIDTEENLSDVLKVYGLPGPKVRQADVHAERDRRLAMGFDYDFGDERGVHHFRTTKADNEGWSKVTTIAQAALNLSQPNFEINIATATGTATVTATDRQFVLLAAGQFEQPIWGASFVLEAMDPIPADFHDDSHWSNP